jgi:cytochrome c2
MDSFEWNKIAGAVLFALLVTFGLSIFSEILFETEAPESPGYIIAVAEEPAEGAAGAEGGEPASQPIGVLMAAADPGAGEAAAKKCATCHTFGQGEPAKVGPNLWDVVNRPIASTDYEYDEAMHKFAEEAKTWTYEHLNAFLHDPKGTVPGTKMAFAGLRNDKERANVIAYLRTLSANPAPLPVAQTAEAAPAGETASDAGGAAPAAPAATAQAEQPAAGGQQTAAAEPSGTGAESAGQPQGSPGAIDSTSADQQGGAPQIPPAQQPEAQAGTPAAQAEAPAAPAQQPAAAEQTAPAGQQAEAPAEPAEQQVAQTEAPAAAPADAGASAFAPKVAAADADKGKNLAKRCAACHTFEKDGANKIGPHLWGIVNRPIASVPDFEYSDAMKAFGADGKTWTYDELSAYLENPKEHIPGNKMAFPGLRKEDDRADVIAYLRTLADTPAPLPGQ